MRLSTILYSVASAIFAAGILVEIHEIKQDHEIWVKAGANGSGPVVEKADQPRSEPVAEG